MIKTRKDIEINPPILVEQGICDNCGVCVSVCPTDCIILTTNNLTVIGEECIRCGICITACPVAALRWHDDSGNGRGILFESDDEGE